MLWNGSGQYSSHSWHSGFYCFSHRGVDLLPQWRAQLVLGFVSLQNLFAFCTLHKCETRFSPNSVMSSVTSSGQSIFLIRSRKCALLPWDPITCLSKWPWTISTSGDCCDAFIVEEWRLLDGLADSITVVRQRQDGVWVEDQTWGLFSHKRMDKCNKFKETVK